MKVLRSIPAAARFCRQTAQPLVLVPTMGALHRGHAALVARARKLAGREGTVVVSIFVNPTQFGPKEDFSRYPRSFDSDRRICEAEGTDAIFYPSAEEMYPADFSTWVHEENLSRFLCGASRPGHFRGVCTVVLKLFLVTQPAIAVFGLKDYQQCAVIKRMVRDLNLPIRIVGHPTVREPDGLALSSRNAYLSPDERAQAPALRQALLAARESFRSGETSAAALRRVILGHLRRAPLGRVDYLELVDGNTLQPVRSAGKNTVCAAAVFFGTTRLIDNQRLG